MKVHVTDFIANMWRKVITQIKTLSDALDMIWPQVVSSEKCQLWGRANFESVRLQWLP